MVNRTISRTPILRLKSCIVGFICLLTACQSLPAADSLILKNKYVLRELTFDGRAWRTCRFSRADGTDEIPVQSDEFHILFMDDATLTINDYRFEGPVSRQQDAETQKIRIDYVPGRDDLDRFAPKHITIIYSLDDTPYLRKQVILDMEQGQFIDRLEVERFSTSVAASRGGRGEPVFIGDSWFFGLEYPAFYSRHTDGNTPRAYSGPYDLLGNYSQIFLDGRDEDKTARPGLVRLMHFPGYAKKQSDGKWRIVSKTAVCGVGRPGDSLELAFLDYLDTIRKPVRSFIHYNNWYDSTGKDLSINNFVDSVFMEFKRNLEPYGVHIDAMVPDNGWQNGNSIYDLNPRHFPKGIDDFEALSDALQKAGTNLGVWMSLNGYGSNINWGVQHGYLEAVRNKRFERFGRYYSIVYPKYNARIRERLQTLITRGNLKYIKHDFNEMCDIGDGRGHLPTDRHGHEASVDAELELLALERQLQPDIYQNVTNWIWFSPWWLSNCNNLWMLAGDNGLNRNWPQISSRKMAITYRDAHLFNAWGDPRTRPLVPISHLMTHGIIYADRCMVEQPGDTLNDWSDYVVMYYGRGLQLKEWYITPSLMTPDRWRVLGQATRWSQENVNLLANAVMVGGKPDEGRAYGYVCWKADRAIMTLRNPDIHSQTLAVPFDRSVWYRGSAGKQFKAAVIYPARYPLAQTFVSGKPMHIKIAPYTTMVIDVQPGAASGQAPPTGPVPRTEAVTSSRGGVTVRVGMPDEQLRRCDLFITSKGELPAVKVAEQTLKPSRTNQGRGWRMACYDLLAYGSQKTVELVIGSVAGGPFTESIGNIDVDVLWDRPCKMPSLADDKPRPWAVRDGSYRQSSRVYSGPIQTESRGASMSISAEQIRSIKAAKLRIRHFGSNGGGYADKPILLNGFKIGTVPVNSGGDRWQTSVIDIPKSELARIAADNEIVIQNRPQDKFKVKDLQIAVQLPDGRWVASSNCSTVNCSHSDWLYAEGDFFADSGSESKPIRLSF